MKNFMMAGIALALVGCRAHVGASAGAGTSVATTPAAPSAAPGSPAFVSPEYFPKDGQYVMLVGRKPGGFGKNIHSVTVKNESHCWLALEVSGEQVVFTEPRGSRVEDRWPPTIPKVKEGETVRPVSLLKPGEVAYGLFAAPVETWRGICYQGPPRKVGTDIVLDLVGVSRGESHQGGRHLLVFHDWDFRRVDGQVW